MNKTIKAATLINFEGSSINPFHLRPSFFHSSPFLERRRRTHWESGGGAYKGSPRKFNIYNKRFRKLNAKQALLRNVSSFAEQLFQSWKYDNDERDASSNKNNSWFEPDFGANRNRGERSKNGGPKAWSRREFHFCEDDDVEVETIFRSAFGGNPNFYWSFTYEEPEERYSSSYSKNFRNQRNWRYFSEDEYESAECDSSGGDLTTDRLALGLSASGPLNLEDVKNAYRACALKWHPDRHQGSSKAVAEEKFKICSSAYQSLCDKLVID